MPNSPTSELVNRTQTYPLKQLEYAFDHPRWPYGYGIGTCTLGGQYVTRIMHAASMYIGVESGYGNLVLELGIVGLILWIVLGFSIAFSAWKVVNELAGHTLVSTGLCNLPLCHSAFLSDDVCRQQCIPGLRLERLPLATAWHSLSPADVPENNPDRSG